MQRDCFYNHKLEPDLHANTNINEWNISDTNYLLIIPKMFISHPYDIDL